MLILNAQSSLQIPFRNQLTPFYAGHLRNEYYVASWLASVLGCVFMSMIEFAMAGVSAIMDYEFSINLRAKYDV